MNQLRDHINDIINAASSKTLEATKSDLRELSKQWAGQDNSQKLIILSSVATLVLLYRSGNLKDIPAYPKKFVVDFVTSLFTIEENLRLAIGEIDGQAMMRVASQNSEVTSVLWRDFLGDEIIDNSWKNIGKAVIGLNGKIEGEWRQLNDILLPKPKKINANKYFTYSALVEKELQNRLNVQDLVMLDAIQLGEYESKGVIQPISQFLTLSQVPALTEIGTTLNGYLVGLPITRNFHVFGYSSELADSIKVKIKEIRSLEKFLRLANTNELSWEKPKKHAITEAASSDQNGPRFSHKLGKDDPVVPMQAARGPHVVYSVFAYVNDSGTDGFLKTSKVATGDEKTVVHIAPVGDLIESFSAFLEFCYCFVPVISLALDQALAAKYRSLKQVKNLWFDPCIPIESTRFQEEGITFTDRPITVKDDNTRPLSCIGGYCLCVTSRSDSPRNATDFAMRFVDQYTRNASLSKPFSNSRVRKNEGESSEFIPTPHNAATRPNFSGWRLVEEQVSESVRLFMAAVFVYREIVASTLTSKDSLKAIPEFIISSLDSSAIEQMIVGFRNELEQLKTMEDNKEVFDGPWLEANLDSLKMDSASIWGILTKEARTDVNDTDRTASEPRTMREFVRSLGAELGRTLYFKLRGLCSSNGWAVEDMK